MPLPNPFARLTNMFVMVAVAEAISVKEASPAKTKSKPSSRGLKVVKGASQRIGAFGNAVASAVHLSPRSPSPEKAASASESPRAFSIATALDKEVTSAFEPATTAPASEPSTPRPEAVMGAFEVVTGTPSPVKPRPAAVPVTKTTKRRFRLRGRRNAANATVVVSTSSPKASKFKTSLVKIVEAFSFSHTTATDDDDSIVSATPVKATVATTATNCKKTSSSSKARTWMKKTFKFSKVSASPAVESSAITVADVEESVKDSSALPATTTTTTIITADAPSSTTKKTSSSSKARTWMKKAFKFSKKSSSEVSASSAVTVAAVEESVKDSSALPATPASSPVDVTATASTTAATSTTDESAVIPEVDYLFMVPTGITRSRPAPVAPAPAPASEPGVAVLTRAKLIYGLAGYAMS